MKELFHTLWEKAEPVLAASGLELVDLDLTRQGGKLLIRIFIDRADQSSGGVTVDECGNFNLEMGRLLDTEDLIAASYLLEVSSPGIDRRVRKPSDFRKFLGRKIRVSLREMIDGRKKLKGELLDADESGITVGHGEGKTRAPYDAISKANLEYEKL